MKDGKITLKRAVNCSEPPLIKEDDKRYKSSIVFFEKNGFHYEECWNLDSEVAYQILIRLVQYRKTGCEYATPACFEREGETLKESNKRWKTQVDKMIRAFYLYTTVFSPDKKQQRIINKGMDLFFKHYSSLWY